MVDFSGGIEDLVTRPPCSHGEINIGRALDDSHDRTIDGLERGAEFPANGTGYVAEAVLTHSR